LVSIGLSSVTLLVVAVGIGWAILKYRTVPVVAPENVSIFTKAARNDLYQDAFNEALFMRPGDQLTKEVDNFDRTIVDGAVNGVGKLITGLSLQVRKLQNGYVRSYALLMSVGILVLFAAVWLVVA
jgi:NADH-quinone oxidoreductase subunit L